ncbi:MAG: copper chaperone PCu(A)C [Ardenticatenales bacterium]|nr:copper chaperone PCu(A)C [Ardenticatenales bacterium]
MSNRTLLTLGTLTILALTAAACGGGSTDAPSAGESAANATAPVGDSAGITTADVWARKSPMAATMGAVYLRIDNHGAVDDALIGAAAAVAHTVEIHETTNEGGVMSMAKVDAIPVPAGGSAELKPGGYHVMLIDVTAPLKLGERFPVTLQFEKAGMITVEAEVREE